MTAQYAGGGRIPATAEHVSQGHPDKFCDQVADSILDAILAASRRHADGSNAPNRQRTAIEMLAKEHLVVVSGEVRMGPDVAAAVDIDAVARQVWRDVGYPDAEKIVVLDHVRAQSPELQVNADADGAGDQGIMVGFATNETPTFMPPEYELARSLCRRIRDIGRDGTAPFVRADAKTQATLDRDGRPTRIVIAVQHAASIDGEHDPARVRAMVRDAMMRHAVVPIFGRVGDGLVVVNGSGSFVVGGPIGDAGVVGRKIAVDAFGPSVPVGGGAYSGKDPTKVDRSAAYAARWIAKTAVALGVRDAGTVTVSLAYAIGSRQPEMVTATTDKGVDISDWVHSRFPDLSPRAIGELLGLWQPQGWSYRDTAAFGHYGRDEFPWERIADVKA